MVGPSTSRIGRCRPPKVYAQFWTTCQPGPTNNFFSGLENGLRARDLEVTYHRTQSKNHGQFGMRCINCGMSVVLQWPRALTSEQTSLRSRYWQRSLTHSPSTSRFKMQAQWTLRNVSSWMQRQGTWLLNDGYAQLKVCVFNDESS